MDSSKIKELQKEVVLSLAGLINNDWSMIVLNIEYAVSKGATPITDSLCFWVYDSSNGFKGENLSFTESRIGKSLLKLRTEMAKIDGKICDIIDLTIESSGKYYFRFYQDGPKRIAGIFDFESMFRYHSFKEEYERRKDLIGV